VAKDRNFANSKWRQAATLKIVLLRDTDMHSVYLLRRRGWVAGGWLVGWMSHAGIVLKRLNLS